MKCSLPARIRLVSARILGNWSGRLLIALAPIFYSSSSRQRGRQRGGSSRRQEEQASGSRQQAAANSLSGRLTNCVKALQQSANRFRCTSVPCSGALVASTTAAAAAAATRSRTSSISRTGSKAFSLADCDALIKYDYAFDCSSSRSPTAEPEDSGLNRACERETAREQKKETEQSQEV